MTAPRLIGLTGRARAGKDSVAEVLCRLGYSRCSLADPIKRGLASMFGFTKDQLYGEEKEVAITELGRSPRQMLQTLGTEWGRQLVHPDLWLFAADREIDAHERLGVGVVVPDIRFPNEAEWVLRRGGLLVRVVRPNGPNVAAHTSEAGVPEHYVNCTITNNGTLDDLEEASRSLAIYAAGS